MFEAFFAGVLSNHTDSSGATVATDTVAFEICSVRQAENQEYTLKKSGIYSGFQVVFSSGRSDKLGRCSSRGPRFSASQFWDGQH
jgi:hypothetical protein